MRAVLTYHSIDGSGSPISIAPAAFRQHIAWLASGAVPVLPLAQLCTPHGGHDAGDAIALTFDDGFANFAVEVAPLLRAHRLPATLFVVSGHVGRDNQWADATRGAVPVMPLLDWDALGAVAEDGVEIGAHTRSHPHLSRLPSAAIEDEVCGGQEDIAARTGRRPTSFAYPYGDHSDPSVAIVRRAFSCACTTEYRALRDDDDPARVPRLDAWYFRAPGALESWGSASFRVGVSLRGAARRARRVLRAD